MVINMGSNFAGESICKVQGALQPGNIDVLAWSWGMSSQSGSSRMGGGAAGGAGKSNFQDLSFTKYVDSASNALMLCLAKGQRIPVCVFMALKDGGPPIMYTQITMTDVMVSSISTGGSGGQDRFTENVTLNFGKVKFSYFKSDGNQFNPTKDFAWDIGANSALSA